MMSGEILEKTLMRGKLLVLKQYLMPSLLQPNIVIVGHPVVADDGEALLKQQAGKMESDETGGAGD